MKVGYKIVINHKNVPKKDFSEVSLDDKTGLCSIATGRTNDNIVCILLGVGGRWSYFRSIFRIWGLPLFLKPMMTLNTNQVKFLHFSHF